jgi:hypothetical protein
MYSGLSLSTGESGKGRLSMKTKLTIAVTAFALALGLTATNARADTLTFNFNPTGTFSGTAPAGSLTATFTGGVSGGIQLTITSNLATGENLDPGKARYLNIDPTQNSLLSAATFTLTGNTGFSQAATVSQAANNFKPDGDGLMDILFTYSPSTKAFTTGESQTYLITGLGTSASIFDFSSFCGSGCGTGSHLAAIHVQNTPSGGSGSAFVGGSDAPVPDGGMTLMLLGGVLVGFETLRRKFRV